MSDNIDGTPETPDEFSEDQQHLQANYARLQEVLADYRGASEPEKVDGSTLKQRIMEIVQQESLRGPSTDLTSPRGNRYGVTTSAIRAEVREVIDGTGGLRARRSRTPLRGRIGIASRRGSIFDHGLDAVPARCCSQVACRDC